MTLGLTIPGVPVLHVRESWIDKCFPVIGPAQNMANITQPVAHYTAAVNLIDGDPGESVDNIPAYLRAINRDYWKNRKNTSPTTLCGVDQPGYAIGYCFAVDYLGGAWELRGFDVRGAANAGHNTYTFPILFLVDGADAMTPAAAATARNIWREAKRRSGRGDFKNRPLGHGELFETTGTGTPTACPGAGVLGQLHDGILDLDFNGGNDMIYLDHPERAMDTRPGKANQDQIDPILGAQNADLPRAPLTPGKPLKVFVGMQTQYEVAVTYVHRGGQGWIEVTGSDEPPTSSCGNYYPGKPIDCQTVGVATADGHIRVWIGGSVDSAVDIIVDVRGRG